MKRIKMLFAGLMMASMCFAADKTVTLTVNPGMRCGGCAGRVKKALLADKGVKDVTIDLAIQAVTVTYDDAQTNEANLLKDLEAGKYQGKVTTVEALKKAAEAKAAEAKKEGGCHGGGGCHKAGGNDKK